jgi:protein LSM14
VPLIPLQAKPGNAPKNLAQQQQSATQTAAAAVAAAMAKLSVTGPTDAAVDNSNRRAGEMRNDDRNRQSRHPGPGPGPGGFVTGHRGARGGRRPSNRDLVKPVDVPTTDFDFETSNAKFNKQDMVKEAIATGSPLGTPAADELSSSLGGESNGFEDSQAEREVVIPGANYNKSSSFFDNISSELKDRQAAQDVGRRMGGMEFRTEERKKNFETFGQANVDNGYRGGFRGRGRGRGFGGRGGPRGNGGGMRGGFAPRGGASSRGGDASFTAES